MEGERASENSICLSSYSLCFGYCFEISSPATWVFDSFFGSLVNTAFSFLLHAQLLAQPSWKTKVASFVGDGAGKTALGSEQPRFNTRCCHFIHSLIDSFDTHIHIEQ